MGREYFNPIFTLNDIMDAMTVTDVSDASKPLVAPSLFDGKGYGYQSQKEAEEALKNGKPVIVVEHSTNGHSNMVYCALGKGGRLAISNSKEFISRSGSNIRKPSFGRRFAYRVLGRFTDVSKRYPDVAEYNLAQETFHHALAEMKADWKKHQSGEPVTSVETMENKADPEYEEIEKKTAELRVKQKMYVPGVSPIDVHFTAPEILDSPDMLRNHAKKRQLALTQQSVDRHLSSAYPYIDQSRLSKDERSILNLGVGERAALYSKLSSSDPGEYMEFQPNRWANIAAAQFLHVLICKAALNPDGPERRALDYFNQHQGKAKGQNSAWNTFKERIIAEFGEMHMSVADIHKYLETPEGSAFLLEKAETAFMTMGVWNEADKEAYTESLSVPSEVFIAAGDVASEAGYQSYDRAEIDDRFGRENAEDGRFEESEFTSEQTYIDKGKEAALRINSQLAASDGGACAFNPDDVVDFIMGESFSVLAQNEYAQSGERDTELYAFLREGDNAARVAAILKERFTNQPVTETEFAALLGDGSRDKMINLLHQAKDIEQKQAQGQPKTAETVHITKIKQQEQAKKDVSSPTKGTDQPML